MPSKKKIKLLPPRPPLKKWYGAEEGWIINNNGCKVFYYSGRYENIIWNFYDKKKFWIKHAPCGMILIIECGDRPHSQYELDKYIIKEYGKEGLRAIKEEIEYNCLNWSSEDEE